MRTVENSKGCLRVIIYFLLLCMAPQIAAAQQLKIADFVLFGGAPGQGGGVILNSSTNVNSGAIGSYTNIQSTGNSAMGGNLHSGGTINLTNSNTIGGNITVANSAAVTALALQVGSSAAISGNIDVKGNTLIGGGTVRGIVTHPAGTTYSGPVPLGGNVIGVPVIPTLPPMPAINPFPAAGTVLINNNKVITPGAFGRMGLTGNKKVTFSGTGTYIFSEIANSGTTNNFVFDFLNNTKGSIKIYVHGNINLGKINVTIVNGGSERRIYTETHGSGSTAAGGLDAFIIANGSAGTSPSKWAGMVWAPNASINIGSGTGGSDLNGSLWSNKKITLQSGVKINFFPLDAIFPAGKIEEPIGSELTLLNLSGSSNPELPKNVFIISGDNVYIEVIARAGRYAELLTLLQSSEYGLTDIISNVPGSLVITGKFPIARLQKLNVLPDLIDYVRPLVPPVGNSGITYTRGDSAINTNAVRNGYGVYGEGIKIGVLSDSYNSIPLDPAKVDVDNGDLPGVGNTANSTPVSVLKEYPFGQQSDEGRAMLQIIHDIAPKATLAFRTGFISAGDFANGIKQLQAANCNIIVDDITHITEPYFQDGVVAKAVDAVTALGVSYVTAAGNYGSKSYEGTFNPTAAPTGFTGTAHNFGGGDVFQSITVKPGDYTIVLQWDDAFYSLGQTPGAINDLDIFLTDNNGRILSGLNRNNTGADPIEILSFRIDANTTPNTNILITRAAGSANVRFKYIIFRGEVQVNEFGSQSSTIVGQANAVGAMTVGAVLYTNTAAFGGVPSMASFSSRGGTAINGMVRNKPDFAAPNGVNTTVDLTGGNPALNIDNDQYPNFFGTSAAAPHVAAAAALLINASEKYALSTPSPAQIRALLANSAIDIAPAGFDLASGSGFIQPDVAVRTFASPKPTITELVLPATNLIPGTAAFTVTVKGDFIDSSSQIFLRGQALTTTFVSSTVLTATIPVFSGNPPLYVYTPPTSTSQLDGGYSDTLFFFSVVKKKITITADNKTKRYGEDIPAYTATVLVDGFPLADTEYTLAGLGLDSIKYNSAATTLSNVNNYVITPLIDPLDPTKPEDLALLERNVYEFRIGTLSITKLPLKITPKETIITYGDAIGNFKYTYDYDDRNILNKISFSNALSNTYQENLANAVAFVNAKAVVNGRTLTDADLINLSFLVSARALTNSRQVVNAKQVVNSVPVSTLVVDVAAESVFSYHLDSLHATLVNAIPLVNAKAMINARAMINGTATLNSRVLINASSMVNSSTVNSSGGNVAAIVDSEDFTAAIIDSFKSINLVTGITAGQFTVVPGAFLSGNFDITYGLGKLTILPAPLTVKVGDYVIFNGSPLPVFKSVITGFQYDDSLKIISGPTYTPGPTFVVQPGVYQIIPSDLKLNPDNLNYNISYVPGTLYVNPKGPGARKLKPSLDCVEVLTNDPRGFKYVAHFSYENPNPTPVFVPIGDNNSLKAAGSFSGVQPELFLPTGGKFNVYFNGQKLTWTVVSYEVNQKSSVASSASSTSSKCNFDALTSTLLLTTEVTADMTSSARYMNASTEEWRPDYIRVSPNPVRDLVTINWKDISDKEIIILDINGKSYQLPDVRQTSPNSLELNLSGFQAGLYLIKVKSMISSKVVRVIKM
jgi:hypothetical protein